MADVLTWVPPVHAYPIWEGTPPEFQPDFNQPVPTLTPFWTESSAPHSAVIVLPGGGYGMKAAHEAGPVAEWLSRIGITAFVLDYRIAPYRYPVPLLDARRAVQYVRNHALQWSIDPKRVAVLGFSAGGHLASTLGTHFEPLPTPDDAYSKESFVPNAMILCYPVITFKNRRHPGSLENLLGPNPPLSLMDHLSNETQVSPETPPAFIWHTTDDASVSIEDSLPFIQSLSACHVPYECHIFAHGEHGLGLATDHPFAKPWTGLCEAWLQNLGFIP